MLSDKYRDLITSASQEHDVPEDILYNLIETESGFNPTARSPKGALGIAQFMPATAKELGVDPLDPLQAIPGSAKYLRSHYNKFGDWPLALAAYNAGPGAVEKHKGIPPFPETQEYVKKIMGKVKSVSPSADDAKLVDKLFEDNQEHGLLETLFPKQATASTLDHSKEVRAISERLHKESALGTIRAHRAGIGPMGGTIGTQIIAGSVEEFDTLKSAPILSDKFKEDFIETIKGYGSLATQPMEILRGFAELVWSMPGLALGVVNAGRHIAERLGRPATLSDLYDAASNGMSEANELWREHMSEPLFGAPTKEKELVGMTAMAPALALSQIGGAIADKFEGYPNVQGAFRFAGDIGGLFALGRLMHGGKGDVTAKVEDITNKGADIARKQKLVDETPDEAVKRAQQRILDLQKKKLEEEASKLMESVDYGEWIREDLHSKSQQIQQAKQAKKYSADEAVNKAMQRLKEQKPKSEEEEVFRGPGGKNAAEVSAAVDEMKEMKTETEIEKKVTEEKIATKEKKTRLRKKTAVTVPEPAPAKDPIVEVDTQTGRKMPEFDTDHSPFREDPQKTKIVADQFKERNYRDDVEMTTQKLINDVNRWLDGDNEVDIEAARNGLSILSTRSAELWNQFTDPSAFRDWQEVVSEASSWARRAEKTGELLPKIEQSAIDAEKVDLAKIKALEDRYGKTIDKITDEEIEDFFVDQETTSVKDIDWMGEGSDVKLGVFLGYDSRLPRAVKDLYQSATSLIQQGVSIREIWESTGWFLNPYDGKWRYEIDDSKMRLTPAFEQLPLSEIFKKTPNAEIPLHEAIHYPELFERHPEAKDVKVRKQAPLFDIFRSTQGWFDEKTNSIVISPYAIDPREVMIHEIQHKLQEDFNFARGGNKRTAIDLANSSALRAFSKVAMRALKKDKKLYEESILPGIKKRLEDVKSIPSKLHNEVNKLLEERAKLDENELRDYHLFKSKSDVSKGWTSTDTPPPDKNFYSTPEGRKYMEQKQRISRDLAQITGLTIYDAIDMTSRRRTTLSELRKVHQEEMSRMTDAYNKVVEKENQINFPRDESTLRETLKSIDDVSYNAYKALAGEIESRDASARMNLTMERRREQLPLSSENIPAEQVIVDMGSGGKKQPPSIRQDQRGESLRSGIPLDEVGLEIARRIKDLYGHFKGFLENPIDRSPMTKFRVIGPQLKNVEYSVATRAQKDKFWKGGTEKKVFYQYTIEGYDPFSKEWKEFNWSDTKEEAYEFVQKYNKDLKEMEKLYGDATSLSLHSGIPFDKLAKEIKDIVKRRSVDFFDGALYLPDGTSVTRENAQRLIKNAKARIAENEDLLRKINSLSDKADIQEVRNLFGSDSRIQTKQEAKRIFERTISNSKQYIDDIEAAVRFVESIKETTLRSGAPLDELSRTIIDGAKRFKSYTEKAAGLKRISFGEGARMLRREFTRHFVDRSGNIRQELLDKLGDEGYNIVQKMYLSKGASSISANMLKQLQKEIYGGLSRHEKQVLDRLVLATRLVDIAQYKEKGKFKFPEDISPEKSIAYTELFPQIEGLDARTSIDLKRRAAAYFEWMKHPLKDMLDAGLISQEEFTALSSHQYRRVKLVDIFDHRYSAKIGDRKRTVYDSGVQTLARGRDTDIFEPSSEIMALEVFNRAYGRIMNNEANKTLLNLALRDPENPFVKAKTKPGDKIPTGWSRVFVFEEGQRKSVYLSPEMSKEWIINSPEMTYRMSQLIRLLSGSAVLRTFATGINWGFALANLPRDVMHAWYAARVFENGEWRNIYNPNLPVFMLQMGADQARVFTDAVLRKGRYEDYIKEGGGMEFLVHQGRLLGRGRRLEGPLDKLQDFLGYFGETSEIMTRLALRERVIRRIANEKNISVEEARSDPDTAKEATFAARDYMDFGQGGGISKGLDNAFPYLNAAIQGTRGILRAYKENPYASSWKTVQLATVTTGIYLAARHNTPNAFEALKGSNDMKNNLCIPLPESFAFEDDQGQMRYPYIKIPLDPAQKFFKTFFEAAVDKCFGHEVDIDRVTGSLKELSPVGVTELPPSMSAVLGYMTNKDFWLNEDIWKRTDKPFSWPQSKEEYIPGETPQAFIDIGKATGLSPERLRHSAEEMFTSGTIWSYMLGKGYDEMFSDMPKSNKEQHWAEALSKFPGIKRFIGITHPYSKHAKGIDEAKMKADLDYFIQTRGLDTLAEGHLFQDNVTQQEVWKYINSFKDPEVIDRLTKRFDFQQSIKDLSERSFWLRLQGLKVPARAEVYLKRMDSVKPEERRQLEYEQSIIAGAGGVFSDQFWGEVEKLKSKEFRNRR